MSSRIDGSNIDRVMKGEDERFKLHCEVAVERREGICYATTYCEECSPLCLRVSHQLMCRSRCVSQSDGDVGRNIGFNWRIQDLVRLKPCSHHAATESRPTQNPPYHVLPITCTNHVKSTQITYKQINIPLSLQPLSPWPLPTLPGSSLHPSPDYHLIAAFLLYTAHRRRPASDRPIAQRLGFGAGDGQR